MPDGMSGSLDEEQSTLRYSELLPLLDEVVEAGKIIKNSPQSLAAVAKAFDLNIARMAEFALMPGILQSTSFLSALAMSNMGKVAQGLMLQSPTLFLSNSNLHYHIYTQELHSLHVKFGKPGTKESFHNAWKFGAEHVEQISLVPGMALDNVFYALYSSLVIAAWTAFETLAADLWVAAVNTGAGRLALLEGEPKRIVARMAKEGGQIKPAKDDANFSGADNELKSKKLIKLQDLYHLSNGTFNLGSCMGNVLKAKFNFTVLDDTRGAYSSAFKLNPELIDDILIRPELDVASLARNLIVHRGGIADQVYLEKTKRLTSAPRVTINTKLPLDGAIVRGIASPIVKAGTDLIMAVGKWIEDHPFRPIAKVQD